MGDKFYKSINDYYDYIFPLSDKQVEFVRSEFSEKTSKLVEVGCANGKLTHALSDYDICGIDLESSFIDIASKRYPKIDFSTLNMLDIDKLEGKFDGIICFGNTLVHISEEQVGDFLSKSFDKLNSGGKILIQILNYNYILDDKITDLPAIENKNIVFVRKYKHEKQFIFETHLLIKSENRVIDNKVILSPIRKEKLVELSKKAGFKEIRLYGDFSKSSLDNESMPLILCGKK